MRNTKADRRSQRTRRLLSAALIDLLLEQRYDEITVQKIIERADVGRSTFYAHYLDKEDVLVSNVTDVLDTLTQDIVLLGSDGEAAQRVAPFFHHVQQHHHLYKALLCGGTIDLLYKACAERLRLRIELQLQSSTTPVHTPAMPLPLIATYIAGAIMNMLLWWLDQDMPYSPEQMDTMFQQLVLPGVQRTLQGHS